jgi:hypothetical protein
MALGCPRVEPARGHEAYEVEGLRTGPLVVLGFAASLALSAV